jgi:hypothetical protein
VPSFRMERADTSDSIDSDDDGPTPLISRRLLAFDRANRPPSDDSNDDIHAPSLAPGTIRSEDDKKQFPLSRDSHECVLACVTTIHHTQKIAKHRAK